MRSNKKVVKYFYYVYLVFLLLLVVIERLSLNIIDESSLFSVFDENISLSLVFMSSFIIGLLIYHYGFYKKNEKRVKIFIGYLSFGVCTIFSNVCLCFVTLILINLYPNENNQEFYVRGVVLKSKQYKLSKTVEINTKDSSKIFFISSSKKYEKGDVFEEKLKKGYLNIIYN